MRWVRKQKINTNRWSHSSVKDKETNKEIGQTQSKQTRRYDQYNLAQGELKERNGEGSWDNSKGILEHW